MKNKNSSPEANIESTICMAVVPKVYVGCFPVGPPDMNPEGHL